MRASSPVVFAALLGLASASPAPRLASRADQLLDCLTSSLSPEGSVILPSDPAFAEDTSRFSALYAPTFRVVSKVANEQDVRASIQCSQQTNTTFLVTGPRHGFYAPLQNFNGLEIFTAALNQISVDPNANTMTVGGATNFGQVIDALYAVGKDIATGSGLTVGIVGASLGAGIGRLEGLRGFIADSLLSVRIMLPDTTVVEASEQQNPELFWGIRGAGFNFGVILNATYRVYDQVPNGLHLNADLLFPANITQKFYESLREEASNMPAPLSIATATSFFNGELTLLINAVYAGPESEGRAAIQFLLDLGPTLLQNITVVSWKDLIPTTFFNNGAATGPPIRRSPATIAFNTIDPSAQVAITQQLQDMIAQYPQTASSSLALYFPATQAARAKPQDSTAYPWRDVLGHMVFEVNYNDNTSTDATVDNYYAKMRDTFAATAGTPSRQVYVGFSHGDEPLEEIFSRENLPRLAKLKKRYDPEGWFNAYHPLPTEYP